MQAQNITLQRQYAVQEQALQENGSKPRAGCNIEFTKMVKYVLVPNICHVKIMLNIRKLTVINISG